MDRENYNEQRNIYNNKLTAAKQTYYKNKITEATDPRQRFNTCNDLLNRGNKVVLPTHECAKELANRFVNFFSEKIEKIRTDLEANIDESDGAHFEADTFSGTPLCEFKPVSCDEVRKIISKSPKN